MARVRLSTARVEMVGAYGGAKWRISMGNPRERGPKMWKMGDERFWRYGCRPLWLIRYFYLKGANGARCHNQTIELVVAVEKGNWQVGWGSIIHVFFYFNVWFWCVPYLVALYQSHASSARTVHVTSDDPSICYEITSKAVNF